MRFVRACVALLTPTLFAGCGYVHFGKMPNAPAAGGDAALATAYSSLSTEHKILKQELALARKEGDTLRIALDRAGGGAAVTSSADLAARLAETSRELASLRASYDKLRADRSNPSGGATPDAIAAAKSELEEKLAVSLRNYTQLQEENAKLRTEVDRTKAENAGLNDQLKAAAIAAERTQSTLSQLNADLLAQKDARARAEQSAESVRAQLSAVLAHGGSSPASNPTSASLSSAKTPSAGSSPTAELRAGASRLRPENTSTTTPPPAPTSALKTRVHVVEVGDTLEKIARQYYGAPERWRTIYDANSALLGSGQPLRAGMELQIPEN